MDTVTKHGHFQFADVRLSLGWAVACRPKTEGVPSGDDYLVRRIGDSTLLAVADGAGSGPEAARVTAVCLQALRETDTASLHSLFTNAHHACRGTRGVALGVTLIDPSCRQMSWCAVGDIDGLMFYRPASAVLKKQVMIQRGGTLGYNLPNVIVQSHEINVGATIIMTSDGIRHDSRRDIASGNLASEIADGVLNTHGRSNDDALVLVATIDSSS
jgi:phosphoserine phosphatase RsbX